MPGDDRLPAEATGWMLVASTAQIGLGQGRCFLIGSRRIALFRLRSGEVRAVDAVCPHRGGPLSEALVGSQTVVCPLHGYKFSLADGRGLDNGLAIGVYRSARRGEKIYLQLAQPADGIPGPPIAAGAPPGEDADDRAGAAKSDVQRLVAVGLRPR